MIDKRKVRLMTTLTMYEEKQGREDIKISEYYRKDYVSFHTIATLIWVTLGYVAIWGLIGLGFLGDLQGGGGTGKLVMLGIIAVVGYFVVLGLYGIIGYRYFNKKHADSRSRIRKYNHGLIRLLKTYERENRQNGKNIDA
ncbi:hypothetical protein M2454_001116 [Aequitasia blattaphilus]|uniref:DUF4133 domain-containing protein n=1 Tax=Aequitasia blattaphilus TaxID=2949332 RepID=A0ABT1E6P9_9FIRM|nr:hypothetical protein [Aequitasia blattaphilus]MCP1101381.1 hypothetical protein [Aequitasia blattaphilus]MCR8614021.1 hypothetical protein [Aequitasia blattaphilus]